jgi:methylmalonyl-CoA mutase
MQENNLSGTTGISGLFQEFPAVSTADWMAAVEKDLKGGDFDKRLVWKTYEGLALRPFYRREDLIGLDWLIHSLPGEAPYVRGSKRGDNNWEVRQDIVNSDLKEANAMALRALERGANGVAFVQQEVRGHLRGVRIETASDLSQLLQGIWLDAAPIHWDFGMRSPVIFQWLSEVAQQKGISRKQLQGSFGYDPYAELSKQGSIGLSSEGIAQSLVAHVKNVRETMPGMRALTVDTKPYHNAGAHIAQEVAIALATGAEMLSQLTEQGLSAADAAEQIGFSFAVGSQYFLEMAKFRVFRLLWSEVLTQFGAESQPAFVHAQTSEWNTTVFDPNVNMLRATTEAMSATLGGVDALSVLPYDSAFREPQEFSYRISRNVQLLLKHESNFDKAVDPAAGSWYIEKITEGLAEKAWKLFQDIESQGGVLAVLQSGWLQAEIAKVRAAKDKNISARKDVFLGTNSYPNLLEAMIDQIQEPVEFLAKGDLAHKPHSESLEIQALEIARGAELFENIRLATERFVQKGQRKPIVYLWTQGSVAMRKARATFAQNFFGCAGYEIIEGPGFADLSEGMAQIQKLNPDVLVLCSSDEEYAEIVPAVCQALLKAELKSKVILAGAPGDQESAYRSAGVEDFIHLRTDATAFLAAFQSTLGVTA